MGPQRAETAPISVARQGPLTCPLATFAVAICNGSKTSTPAVPFAQIAAIPIGVANGHNRPKCPLQRIQLCFVLKSAAVMDAGERAKCSAEATRRLCHGQSRGRCARALQPSWQKFCVARPRHRQRLGCRGLRPTRVEWRRGGVFDIELHSLRERFA